MRKRRTWNKENSDPLTLKSPSFNEFEEMVKRDPGAVGPRTMVSVILEA